MSVEIELCDARVRYGPLEALHGVRLPAPAGAVTVLLGRNGSGRTTALRALAGTVPLAAGRVLRRGEDITRTPAHVRARAGVCSVPDQQAVHPTFTVAENLQLAVHGADFTRALTVYPALGPLLPRLAGTLSGGEQRMLALSRAVLADARVVLVDEPALGMSPPVAAATYTMLTELAARSAAAVVVAEQRLPPGLEGRTAAGVAVIVHQLRRGAVVFSGEPYEFTSRAAE
ncbi:ATP-binding cassette domain-containing protein [Streptomyces sp. NBC_01465]|uniref:ATP-binding cassette domain-containing protein n=1 Tax=Streptomyces sp. NBC_01465 TaxID=2903878 RepID=UPI002E335507|nr:ATP-binding cassette domain-containing protein [Streptomyces sp. NBC_01465]